MGYALPASIGVALSCRDSGDTTSPTVCIVGDGSLFMQNELNTLSANRALADLPLIVLVLNDSSLSYVYQV